jgi:hypothetical protein
MSTIVRKTFKKIRTGQLLHIEIFHKFNLDVFVFQNFCTLVQLAASKTLSTRNFSGLAPISTVYKFVKFGKDSHNLEPLQIMNCKCMVLKLLMISAYFALY